MRKFKTPTKIIPLPILADLTSMSRRLDHIAYFEYIRDLRLTQQIDLVNRELLLSANELKESLSAKQFARLLNAAQLNNFEKKTAHLTQKEKLSNLATIMHSVITGILGVVSGFISYFALSSLTITSVLTAGFTFGVLPALAYVMAANMMQMRDHEKKLIQELTKLSLEKDALEIIEAEILSSASKKWFNFALSTLPLLNFKDKPLQSFDLPLVCHYLKLAAKEKNLSDEEAEKLQSILNKFNRINPRPPRIECKPAPGFTPKKWWRENNKSIMTTLLRSIGTFGGNTVVPSIFILLASSHLAAIHFLGIAALGAFMTTPIGACAMLGVMVLSGCLMIGFNLYREYKIAERENSLKYLQTSIVKLRQNLNSAIKSYTNALKLQKAGAELQLIFGKKSAPTKNLSTLSSQAPTRDLPNEQVDRDLSSTRDDRLTQTQMSVGNDAPGPKFG